MHLLDFIDFHPLVGSTSEKLAQSTQTRHVIHLSGLPSPAWAAIVAALQRRTKRTLLFIAPNSELAEHCLNDLLALMESADEEAPQVLEFPIPDRAGLEDNASGDSRATQNRLATLDALHRDKPVIVVAPASALAQPTLPPDELRHGYDNLAVGQTLEQGKFISHLSETGYERVEEVEAPGQFAVRGGLIDFYPPATGTPLRLELFGDEIDSLRYFDLESQRSTEQIKEVRLTPPREIYLTPQRGREIAATVRERLEEQVLELMRERRENDAEALRERIEKDIARLESAVYFPGLERYRALLYPQQPTLAAHLPDDAIVVWADPERIQIQLDRLLEDDLNLRESSAGSGATVRLPHSPLAGFETLREQTKRFSRVEFRVAPDDDASGGDMDIHIPPAFGGKLDALLKWIKGQQNKNAILVLSTAHARRVREILADGDVRHVHLLDAINDAPPASILVMPQRLTEGFSIGLSVGSESSVLSPQSSVLHLLSDAEMFGWQAVQGRATQRRAKTKKKQFHEQSQAFSTLTDLKEGDYVVHISHGIARYAGVVRQEVAGADNDYLLLEYAGSDRLYLPVGQLDRIQKYMGADAAPPPLTTLRSGEWERTKKKVKEEAAKVAKQLAELYAAREEAEKEPASPDTPWQRELESAFPYEETPSQLQAIKDTKADLETPRPMDRLICGDVGYGKTEVAVRAAFKVVQDGKQVAVLAPTTVLAQQHYATFAERMAPYPVRVEVLSRFRTPGEQRRVLEELKHGSVDLVIGTHRLVQKDVEFSNLGLIIVDEEQRFGVLQKERLKELRQEVDILTLSATPIPRTLQFALGGLREISLINDPPIGRLPVRTYTMPYNETILRAAIERELEREGQIYYVHNRISSIYHVAERLQKLAPHARIGIGHGQMGDEELEQVMLDFMHHRTDVLLATTIIENGLDLPNVNTIIVDRSELLGLSQMYQLRGRVGRSNRQAYAYFFSGSRGKIGETAEERFAALQEHTDLGAGFKIAMRDLEIRGAGDVLGVKQSGSISAVGFELYTQMLSEAVNRLRKQPRLPKFKREELPEADLPVAAFLPPEYIPQESDRLHIYRRMANVQSIEDVKNVQDELRDRFGPLPVQVFNLLRVLKIRVWLLQAKLRSISKSESEVLVRLKPADRFADEDTAAVYARLSQDHDKRALQHISLRHMEGIVVDTRVLTSAQLLRLVEQMTETLATIRGARFMGDAV